MISAKGIKKSFSDIQVLRGVDLEAPAGRITSIVGASGAGKSTLLQILGTLSTPDEGVLTIDGINPFLLRDKDIARFRNMKLGFVFQFHNLLPEFSALENVMIPALIGGKSSAVARQEALRLLEMTGLSNRYKHKPSELSGGECQRVAIARALVNNPSVLLADEPTGNLDSVTKREIHKLFFDLSESLHQTVILVTHDEELASTCHNRLTMKDGLFI